MARPDAELRSPNVRKALFCSLIAIVLSSPESARAQYAPTNPIAPISLVSAIVVSWNVSLHPGAAMPDDAPVGVVTEDLPLSPDVEGSPSAVPEPSPSLPTEETLQTPSQTPSQTPLIDIPTKAEPREVFIELPPRPAGSGPIRAKVLKMTVGVPPTTGDLGSEADTLNPAATIGEDARTVALGETWSFVLKGYLRAPMRIGYGQSDASNQNDRSGSGEFHSMPRMIGMSSSSWAYINIAPNPTASLRATVSNRRVAATLILGTNQFSGAGFADLDSQGGMTQAFLTLKFPETFGQRGGLAWTFGAFGNRYGYAGPRQVNSGYYGTYLFGRTRVIGEALTANIDLTDHLELLIEHGFGAELDILPILSAPDHLEKQMFIPGDPHAQLGSNFVHHAHIALWIDDWLKVAGHYITSWSPDDRNNQRFPAPAEARLSAVGGEVHLDHPRWGNGYLGYSHVWGQNLIALNDALQVIHGGRGYDFKLQYFGNKLRAWDGNGSYFRNDGGRVETILFQHKFFSTGLLRLPPKSRGLMLGLYGMYSHSYSPAGSGSVIVGSYTYPPAVFKDNKLKYGVDLLFAALRNLSVGFRYDRVQPTQSDPTPQTPMGTCTNLWAPFDRSCEQTYMALTPYIWIQPDWNSTRRITVSYTRFLLGDRNYPDSPYSAIQKVADPNLFMISALMSL